MTYLAMDFRHDPKSTWAIRGKHINCASLKLKVLLQRILLRKRKDTYRMRENFSNLTSDRKCLSRICKELYSAKTKRQTTQL